MHARMFFGFMYACVKCYSKEKTPRQRENVYKALFDLKKKVFIIAMTTRQTDKTKRK